MNFRINLKWAVTITLIATAMYSCNTGKTEKNENVEETITEEIPEIIINYEYGLPIDSFELKRGRVGRNQPLSLLLTELGVGNQAIHDIGNKTTGVFDLRKFRSGNNYVAFLSKDTIRQLDYLVYEHSPLSYIVFGFRDSLHVWSANKDVDTIRQTFSGSIESSLWNVIAGKGANPVLAIELSEIYAWSIDFFGLQKGDSIRIIYDELYVDTTSIGIGKIYAAYFRHMNNDFYAIPFIQDSTEEFFDDKGKSLRKAFLKAPLRFSRISSGFSNSRLHPILKIRRPHHGVDYAAPLGTPVQSIGDGRVIKCSYEGGAGHMVKIRHNSIYTTAYLHLSRYGKGIKTGTYVKQGDIIGYVGSSGLSTGPHLDFRFYKNDVPVDPLRVEAPPVDPVREEHMERYLLVKDEVILSLQSFN